MQMVRQDADGVRLKRPARLNRMINLPQVLDLLGKQLACAVNKHNREKEYPTFDSWAPISRHTGLWHGCKRCQSCGRGLLP
jgi:hypothetical protein